MKLFKKKDEEDDNVAWRIVRQYGEKGHYYDVQERCQIGWHVEDNFWKLEDAIECYKFNCKAREINYKSGTYTKDGREQYIIIYCEDKEAE